MTDCFSFCFNDSHDNQIVFKRFPLSIYLFVCLFVCLSISLSLFLHLWFPKKRETTSKHRSRSLFFSYDEGKKDSNSKTITTKRKSKTKILRCEQISSKCYSSQNHSKLQTILLNVSVYLFYIRILLLLSFHFFFFSNISFCK